MTRKFFVVGNFKMNVGSEEQEKTIIKVLNEAILNPDAQVVIAPPALYLITLKDLVRKDIQLAAQNCYYQSSGAFTGEISPVQLVNAGIPYVILGHMERRTLFNETSGLVGTKTKAALDAGLEVILCVGETTAEREAGKTTEVVNAQLQAVVDALEDVTYWKRIVIAYESAWAIGTGKVATAAQAQDALAEIRKFLKTHMSESVAETTRVIYGGSITAVNSKEFAMQPDVDGFLVGSAALKPEFVDIINVKRL